MKQNNYNGALQQPVGSGFNATSTASDVMEGIDLTGKIAIVTGGYTGIGLETTKTLVEAGATVVVPARSIDKARENLRGIAQVEIEEMDLMDPDSIDAFAEKFLASGRPLHLLINNAGIMFVPLRRNSRGIESQLATNYLAPFQLTSRLWGALKKAAGARVVNVSSQGHQFAPFNFEDPNFENSEYQTLQAYGQSKTALNLFSLELDNRAKASGVRAYAVHPGNIWGTELTREAPLEILQQFGFYDDKGNVVPEVIASLKTIPQGTATTIWCATSPLLANIGGVYCEDADVAELALGQGFSTGVKPYALDEAAAKRLWELTGERFGISFDMA
ncbi:SDR family NAD(P)-dependent oxidoreductase [Dyadobacter chenwenxiniae]|uniref:SDR family NAD(P)-dependent oxidoreductase n=1 Tax=Dyadobacter chenwenxiniae TaxID=2906456 RepID=A0A9X1TI00_9BACT|nr:SDR family NAD(P)-dependent oxidoreductase [Dyadobacter chenwenxiniae]MCF0065320.1 SDR family NAD(P)-dependent oxidoreductase [Dyadobacter chenwenxiniae]UON84412.1 SDR family NAD(P)-dependent oxidoreductase [Dyadobacter chenwenxiniae]